MPAVYVLLCTLPLFWNGTVMRQRHVGEVDVRQETPAAREVGGGGGASTEARRHLVVF